MTAIIVEGLDRCGKTTQIKRMMKHFVDKPIQCLHYTAVPGLTPSEQTAFFKRTFTHMFTLILNNPNVVWILDRSHLGETVYAPIYRPEENPNYVWYYEGAFHIAKRDDIALIILYDSSFKNITERDDGDSFSTDIEMTKREIEGFRKAYESTAIKKKIMLDIAGKDVDQVEKEIYEFLKTSRLVKIPTQDRPLAKLIRKEHDARSKAENVINIKPTNAI